MIIAGYPGVGKSTIAGPPSAIIDLESSCFNMDGTKVPNFEKLITAVAEHLNDQGFTVMVSSHAAVLSELRKIESRRPGTCAVVYPALKLKDQWVQRVQDRYDSTTDPTEKEKNSRALKNVLEHFEEQIIGLEAEELLRKLVIESMDHSLRDMVINTNTNE